MIQHLKRCFCGTAFLFLLAASANATTQVADLKRIGNPSRHDAAFGKSVAGMGDQNGDGIGDLVIGAPGRGHGLRHFRQGPDPHKNGQRSGRSFEISIRMGCRRRGRLGQRRHRRFRSGRSRCSQRGAATVRAAPCKPDPQWGRVLVFSGATGALLKEINAPEETLDFGYAIAPLGDLNGDGKQALAVGAPVLGTGFGSVYAMLGTDGTQIWKATETGIWDCHQAANRIVRC